MNETLEYRLDVDRDHSLAAADLARRIYWPLSVFLLNPFVIFVLSRRTQMAADCKVAFVAHHIVLMGFDVYNGLLYSMYPLAPMPIFICTGLLCTGDTSPRLLLTILSSFTIGMCFPYLFIMLRMHQKMLPHDSSLKLSTRAEVGVLGILYATLFANLFGFAAFSIESPEKHSVLKMPTVAWVHAKADKFLVLGTAPGDVGPFRYELIILAISIFICFSFYVVITYHAVFKVGRLMSVHSKTHEAQLRFVYSLTIQAVLSGFFFIGPLVAIFVMLSLDVSHVPPLMLAIVRPIFLMMYSLPSFYHSLVFLVKNPWVISRVRSRSSAFEKSTNVQLKSLQATFS